MSDAFKKDYPPSLKNTQLQKVGLYIVLLISNITQTDYGGKLAKQHEYLMNVKIKGEDVEDIYASVT